MIHCNVLFKKKLWFNHMLIIFLVINVMIMFFFNLIIDTAFFEEEPEHIIDKHDEVTI